MNSQPQETSSFEISPTVAHRSVRVGPRRPAQHQTTIEVEKSDNTIHAITVHCRCGEDTVIQCKYPPTG